MQIIYYLKRNKYLVILLLFGVFFILIYSWLNHNIKPKFTWPDETANYYFTKLFAEKSQLRFNEPLNQVAEGLIRPRSTGFSDGYVVPGSFLGVILIYGLIAKVFGSGIILLLTPLFAVIGVLFFYLLVKEIFNKKVAFISSLLLFIFPAYWYYTEHAMLHNVLFLSLLIIGLYFFIKPLSFERKIFKSHIIYLLSGIFIGLALITRTSEIGWVLFVLFILFIFNKTKIDWLNIIIFLVIIISIFLPILYLNNNLYGTPLSFAYSRDAIDPSSLKTISETLFNKLEQFLFPFGIDFSHIGLTAYQYIILIFPWFFILLIISIFWYIKNIFANLLNKIFDDISYIKIKAKQKYYFLLYILISVWLLVYYGSWEISEHQNSSIILGTSYMRYWLPIYVFGLPICVLLLIKIKNYFNSKLSGNLMATFCIFLLIYFSINLIVLDPLQGLVKSRTYLIDSNEKSSQVESLTEKNSIIISGFNDKVFFPERKVIVYLSKYDNSTKDILEKLINKNPLYYYFSPFDPESDKSILFFKKYNFQLTEVMKYNFLGEILYQLEIN